MRLGSRLAVPFLLAACAGLAPAQEPAPPQGATILDDTELCLDVGNWWDLQRDRFLPPPAGRTPPAAEFVAARVQPALRQALQDPADDTDVVVASLLALGQIAREVPDARLVDDVRRLLRHRTQEVREAAALALGIAGGDGPAELDLLVGLARGYSALGPEEEVAPALRTRAFAVYGLGLLASASPALATQRTVWATLRSLLAATADADLQAAAVHAAGLLRLQFGDDRAEALRGEVVDAMAAFWTARDGAPQDLAACGCPLAIGRLLAREHSRSAEFAARCLAELARQRPVALGKPSLAQSCAIALGLLLRAFDGERLAELGEAAARHPDLHARYFARMALGEVGGGRAQELLLALFHREDEVHANYAAGWTAMALGVALRRADATEADRAVVAKAFAAARPRSPRALEFEPRLLGAGLAGCGAFVAAAGAEVTARSGGAETAAIAFCEAVQLLGQREGIARVRALLASAERRSMLRCAAATALIALGEQDLARQSIDEAAASQNLAQTAALVGAASTTSSVELLDAMLRQFGDPQQVPLRRAFLATAIGRAACRTTEPWSLRLAAHGNHLAAPRTLRNGRDGVLDLR